MFKRYLLTFSRLSLLQFGWKVDLRAAELAAGRINNSA